MAYLPLPKGNEIVCLLEFMKIIYAIVSSDDGNRVTEVLNERRHAENDRKLLAMFQLPIFRHYLQDI